MWQPSNFVVIANNVAGCVDKDKIYKKGDKIAQMVIDQVIPIEFELVDDLTQTQRGEGGFGSSGISIPNKYKRRYNI
jgi:dUTPase